MKWQIFILVSIMVLGVWYSNNKTSSLVQRVDTLETALYEAETMLQTIQYIDLAQLEGRQNETELSVAGLTSQVDIMHDVVSTERLRHIRANKVKKIIRETARLYRNSADYEAARNLTRTQMNDIAYTLVDACDKWDVPLHLFLALIKQESAFNIRAHSHAGAQGLAQIIPSTAAQIAKELAVSSYDPYNIQQNIQFGVYYFATLLDQFDNNITKAIHAYNAGPVRVEKVSTGERHLPRETIRYEHFISNYAREFSSQGIH